jgi:integrase
LTIRKSLEQTKHGLRIKETKGRKIRRLNLPETTVKLLRELKSQQYETRRMFGFDYRSDLDLVFCHGDGNYIRPDVVTKAARRIARRRDSREFRCIRSVTRTVRNCSVSGFPFQRSANGLAIPTFT